MCYVYLYYIQEYFVSIIQIYLYLLHKVLLKTETKKTKNQIEKWAKDITDPSQKKRNANSP